MRETEQLNRRIEHGKNHKSSCLWDERCWKNGVAGATYLRKCQCQNCKNLGYVWIKLARLYISILHASF